MKNRLTVGIIWFVYLFVGFCAAKDHHPRVIVKDLSDQWLVYSEEQNIYVPYIENIHDPKTISFRIDANQFKEYFLDLSIPAKSSLLINNAIISYSSNSSSYIFNIDSLAQSINGEQILLSVYNEELQIDQLKSIVVDLNPGRGFAVPSSSYNPISRDKKSYKDFFIISSILILAATALIRNSTKNAFFEYFSLGKAISLKPKVDGIISNGLFSTSNLSFHFFYGLIIGTSIVSILVWTPDHYAFSIERDTMSMTMYTIIAFLVFTAIMYAKYPLLSIIGGLFKFHKFIVIHYFDYFRITLIVTVMLFVVSIANSSLEGMLIVQYGDVILIAFLIMLLIRSFLIYLKLIKFTNYRKLHLFSYLCTTEIIPLIILLKIFLK